MTRTRTCPFRLSVVQLEDRTAPAAGMLDPTFGVGGRAVGRFPIPSTDSANSIAIDSFGRMVIAGFTGNGTNGDFAVARYYSNGALDTSFGGTGVVTIRFGTSDDNCQSVAIDSLGRIVLAGSTSIQLKNRFAVARLTPAGFLDTSFSGDGKQIVSFGSEGDVVRGVAIDSQDRIILAGSTGSDFAHDFAVARLTTSGELDATFDDDGKQTISFGDLDDLGTCVALDSAGRIMLGGYAQFGPQFDFAVARLTTTGALDMTFSSDGKTTFVVGPSNDYAFGIAVTSLDQIVVAGAANGVSNADIAVARLTSAGQLDASFDGDGKVTVAFGIADDRATGVVIDSLNRIVLAGYGFDGSRQHCAIVRLTVSGGLDSTFDGDGKQTVAFGAYDDLAYGTATDASGRITIVGELFNGINSTDMGIARLTDNGGLDGSFDSDGKQTLGLNSRSDADGRALAVDSLGRIFMAGYARNGDNYDFAVARFTPAGFPDAAFGNAGVVKIPIGASNDQAFAVAVDSFDRIVVGGEWVTASGGTDLAVVRLTQSGALDASFDGDGRQTFTFGATFESLYGLAVDSQDRIIAAGAAANTTTDIAVARLTPEGALDASFDGDGKLTINVAGSTDFARAVTVDSMDRILLAGATSIGSTQYFYVARLTIDGAFDASFDGDGWQTIGFGGAFQRVNGIALDSLGRIIIGGYAHLANDQFAVARLTTTGALDSSFDGDGRQTFAFSPNDAIGYGVAVDSQDRICIAGVTYNGIGNDFGVARFTSGGALDASFDGDGKLTIPFGSYEDLGYAIAMTSADRILVGGSSNYDGNVFALVRLTGDTTTAAAQVNDGSAQRSRVTSLTVRFSGQVTFGGKPSQAFTLARIGGGSVGFTPVVTVENGGTVVTLSNFAGPETEFGSLRDGRFTLTALAAQISAEGKALDGDADGVSGGNFDFGDSQGLFRFFGDINGDRRVNIADYGLFSLWYLNASSYIAAFDFNGDGRVNIADYGQFSLRYLSMLP